MQEYHMALHGSYDGQYDNLLFYFMVHYKLIQVRSLQYATTSVLNLTNHNAMHWQTRYQKNPKRGFTKKMRRKYIEYEGEKAQANAAGAAGSSARPSS